MLSSERRKWIWSKLVPAVITFGGIGALIIRGCFIQTEIKENARYTIGKTIKTFWTTSSGKQVGYYYYVNEKMYKGSDIYNEKVKVPDGRYYVRFSSKNPGHGEIFFDKIVPDSIINPPDEGWEKIPGE